MAKLADHGLDVNCDDCLSRFKLLLLPFGGVWVLLIWRLFVKKHIVKIHIINDIRNYLWGSSEKRHSIRKFARFRIVLFGT